jgi:hypothetical protein
LGRRAPTLALAILLGACGGVSTRPYVAGPYTLPQAAFFDRLAEATRSNGYEVTTSDPASGRLAVLARTTLPRNQRASFVVQCYRPGWFQVTVEGPSIRRAGDQMSMPGTLFEEYRDFTLALMAAVEPSEPGAEASR